VPEEGVIVDRFFRWLGYERIQPDWRVRLVKDGNMVLMDATCKTIEAYQKTGASMEFSLNGIGLFAIEVKRLGGFFCADS